MRAIDESLYYVCVALAVWLVRAYLAARRTAKGACRVATATRARQGIADAPIDLGPVGDEAEVLWSFASPSAFAATRARMRMVTPARMSPIIGFDPRGRANLNADLLQ